MMFSDDSLSFHHYNESFHPLLNSEMVHDSINREDQYFYHHHSHFHSPSPYHHPPQFHVHYHCYSDMRWYHLFQHPKFQMMDWERVCEEEREWYRSRKCRWYQWWWRWIDERQMNRRLKEEGLEEVAITISIVSPVVSSIFVFRSPGNWASISLPLVVRVTDELSVSLAISITSPLPLPMSSHQTALPSLTHYYQFLGFTETTFFQCDVLHNRQIIHTHHTHIGESTLSKQYLF